MDVWRQQLARMLAQRDAVTALEMLDLYHRRGPTTPLAEAYNYCALRFSHPRHLVGLALFGLIRPVEPIVELACGYGHMTASLVRVAPGKPVIGIDQNFFFLFVAKHWIAPEASFICYGMEAALPFAGAAFSAAVCVDGIHFIKNKTTTVREIKRQLAADGVMILASSRNAAIAYPYAGHPLTADGYRRLVADTPHRLVRDGDVLDDYLTGRRPSLVRSASSAELAAAPLISIIASHRADVFNDSGMLETWPHGEGWLGVNPLYVAERRGREGAILRRVFPSAFYLDDNPEMAAYLPEEVAVSGEVLTALDEGRRTPEVARLIEQYVVLGLPER